MDLVNLRTCEKHSLVERLNEEIQAQREKLLASLSADELAVYRVVVAVQIMLASRSANERHCESDVAPKRSLSPEMKALQGQLILTIEQARIRYIELEDHGQLPEIMARLEELGLLPYR